MTVSLQSANVYTDLNSLDAVRRNADGQSPETLKFVAKQFEALFLQMMLKSARDASMEDGLFDDEQSEFYQDLHDKQLAIEMAQGRGLGIAEMLVQQLRSQQPAGDNEAAARVSPQDHGNGKHSLVEYISAARSAPMIHAKPNSAEALPDDTANTTVNQAQAGSEVDQKQNTNPEPTQFEDPQQFVETMWPLAQRAADKLGVSPHVLLAQAALETGWGKHISRHTDGTNSHNLFNIKADSRWQGDTVRVDTTEFRHGRLIKEQAQFRAYGTYAESFEDYVKFLQSSPRYGQALQSAGDNAHFVRQLQQSGYATDPQYADKILKIMDDKPMAEALSSVRFDNI
jgi:flagellar protein FlgJ